MAELNVVLALPESCSIKNFARAECHGVTGHLTCFRLTFSSCCRFRFSFSSFFFSSAFRVASTSSGVFWTAQQTHGSRVGHCVSKTSPSPRPIHSRSLADTKCPTPDDTCARPQGETDQRLSGNKRHTMQQRPLRHERAGIHQVSQILPQ